MISDFYSESLNKKFNFFMEGGIIAIIFLQSSLVKMVSVNHGY